MFRRSRNEILKANAVSAFERALQLAQDRRFRKPLLSAIKHGSEAGRRTRGRVGLTAVARQIARDQALQAELRSVRNDLQRAYERLDAKRGGHRLRKLTVLVGVASLTAVPQLRQRISSLIAKAPKDPQQLKVLANRVSSNDSGASSSRHPHALEDLTKEELYARAQEADIPGRSAMSKEQLVDALRAKE